MIDRPPNNTTVIVGLSGGVDSCVSALLLKEQGYDVHGLFMKNWEEEDTTTYCSAKADLTDVKTVCKRLKIPLHTANFSHEYWEKVFSLFLDEYRAGRTPNPDILCNKEIKFKAFLDHALKLGAEYIATGHYVRTQSTASYYKLLKGLDGNKDQSYFLYTLGQFPLSKTLFPVGALDKKKVRLLAKEAGLITHDKKDSTGICFIGKRTFKNFLAGFMTAEKGYIKTPEGKIIGEHDGIMYYTLGQRRGLKIGGQKGYKEKPWFVVAKDLKNNTLFVTQCHTHPWHFTTSLKVQALHWIKPLQKTAFHTKAKVRYRQKEQDCFIEILSPNQARVTFLSQERAVTPGQAIVFYDQDECLGGGIIESTDSPGGLLKHLPQSPPFEWGKNIQCADH